MRCFLHVSITQFGTGYVKCQTYHTETISNADVKPSAASRY